MNRIVLGALVAALLATPVRSQTKPQLISIVAAENFYGDAAQQLAGSHAKVTSILSNPDQDPHLFEATPSVARDLSSAQIVILNGMDYDPWMGTLLKAAKSLTRKTIVVADLLHRKTGENPHLWYDPPAMPIFARALSAELSASDPGHGMEYEQRLHQFLDSLKLIETKVMELRQKHAGVPVTATEPVFGYMAAALGLKMRNESFQRAVMNNTEPSASDTAAFENDLKQHRVKLLIYNIQATDTAVQRLLRIAQQSRIPVIGVTETEPAGKHYQDWMLDQLGALEEALAKNPP